MFCLSLIPAQTALRLSQAGGGQGGLNPVMRLHRLGRFCNTAAPPGAAVA